MPNWNDTNRFNDENIWRRGDDRTRGNYESRFDERSGRFERDSENRRDHARDYYRAGDVDAHRDRNDMAFGSSRGQQEARGGHHDERFYGGAFGRERDMSRDRDYNTSNRDLHRHDEMSGFAYGQSDRNAYPQGRGALDYDRSGTRGMDYNRMGRDNNTSGMQDWSRGSNERQSSENRSGSMWGQERGSFGQNSPQGIYGQSGVFNQNSSFGRDRGESYTGNVGGSLFGQNDSFWNLDRGSDTSRSYSGRGPKGYRRSDDRIREEVSETLERHPMIDASEIEVDVKDGMVTLRGHAEDRRQKRMAEDIIENLSGVKDIRNELTVNKSLFERAKEALLGEGRTEGATSDSPRTGGRTTEKNPRH